MCNRLDADAAEVGETTPDALEGATAARRGLVTLSSVAAAMRLAALWVDAALRFGAVVRTEVGVSSSSAPRKRWPNFALAVD